jgi:hypothetical protein
VEQPHAFDFLSLVKGCHPRSTKRSLWFVTQISATAGNGQDVAGKRAALEAVKRVLPLKAVVGVVEQAEEAVSAVDYKMAAEQVSPALHVSRICFFFTFSRK